MYLLILKRLILVHTEVDVSGFSSFQDSHCTCAGYSEALAQLIDAGKRVVDSPVHLADFGRFACEGVDL